MEQKPQEIERLECPCLLGSNEAFLMEQNHVFLRQEQGRCAHCGEGYSWDHEHTGKVFHARCLKAKRVLEITSRLERGEQST